jgi:hypothetical protein
LQVGKLANIAIANFFLLFFLFTKPNKFAGLSQPLLPLPFETVL